MKSATMTACAQCGATVENEAVTGIFCSRCFAADVAPRPGWRAYLTGPTALAAFALGLSHTITFHVNGVSYSAAAGGALATVAALIGLASASSSPPEFVGKQRAVSAVVAAFGAFTVATSGVLSLL